MKSHQFQEDRSDALRRQLVQMPTLSAAVVDGLDAASDREQVQSKPVTPLRRPQRVRRGLLATAAVSVGLLVLGQTNMVVQSTHAAEVLRSTAERTMVFVDPNSSPGQYLLVHKRGNWVGGQFNGSGGTDTYRTEQRIDVYVPDDPEDEWVLDREWGEIGTIPGWTETVHAPDGKFYDGMPWTIVDLEELNTLPRDGQPLLEHFDAQYQGGSASRDEDNFVRITDLLKTGLVPADLRAGLYEALALIPGVNTTERQTNLEGEVGIAIGRTEPLRAGQRTEIIIDPDTGQVIGERTLMTRAAFGFGTNEITGHTAIDYQVVGSAPE